MSPPLTIAMVMCGVWTSTCTDSEETRQIFILLLGTAIGVGNAAWSVYWFIRAVVWLSRRQSVRKSSNCVSCGSDVNEDAKFCVRCGEAMHGPTPSAARPESASSAPGDGVKKGYFVQGLKEYANGWRACQPRGVLVVHSLSIRHQLLDQCRWRCSRYLPCRRRCCSRCTVLILSNYVLGTHLGYRSPTVSRNHSTASRYRT